MKARAASAAPRRTFFLPVLLLTLLHLRLRVHASPPHSEGCADCAMLPRHDASASSSPPSSVIPRLDTTQGGTPTLHVGLLFPKDLADGDAIVSAARLAVSQINDNRTVLPYHKLALRALDSTLTNWQCQLQALKLMASDCVALVGPTTSDQAALVSHMAQSVQIPVVSFLATDPTLTAGLDYPYFLRTISSDVSQMQAIADLIVYYQWREVVTLYLNDRFGRNGISTFISIVTQNKRWPVTVAGSYGLSSDASYEAVLAALGSIQALSTSTIVVHAFNLLPPLIFRAASELGMLSSGYAWFATESTTSNLLLSPELRSTAKLMQGVVAVATTVPDSPRLATFMRQWRTLNATESPGSNRTPDVFTLAAYDAVFAVALALHSVLPTPSSRMPMGPLSLNLGVPQSDLLPQLTALKRSSRGNDLLAALLNSSFVGLTGRVDFRNGRDRSNNQLSIRNVQSDGTAHQVGVWDADRGLLSASLKPLAVLSYLEPRSNSLNISWPGAQRQVPAGWFPKRTIQIAIPNKKGYNEFIRVDPSTSGPDSANNSRFSGFCIDLFKAAVAKLRYKLSYEFVQFGATNSNSTPSYTSLILSVANKTYDGAVGDITVTAPRSVLVSFTSAYMPSGLSLIVYQDSWSTVNRWVAFVPFTFSLWALFVAAGAVTAVALWFLERRLFQGPAFRQASDALWVSYVAVFLRLEMQIKTLLGRILILAWLFLVLVLTTSYTANLISIITVQRLTVQTQTISQLVDAHAAVGFQSGSFVQAYLVQLGIPSSLLVPLNGEKEYYDALQSGRVAGIVDEAPYLSVFTSNYCNILQSQQPFSTLNFAFAFQRGSQLAMDFSMALEQLMASGRVQELQQQWLQGNSSCDSSSSVALQFNVQDHFGVFIVYAGVAAACCLLYTIIVLVRGHSLSRRNKAKGSAGADTGSSPMPSSTTGSPSQPEASLDGSSPAVGPNRGGDNPGRNSTSPEQQGGRGQGLGPSRVGIPYADEDDLDCSVGPTLQPTEPSQDTAVVASGRGAAIADLALFRTMRATARTLAHSFKMGEEITKAQLDAEEEQSTRGGNASGMRKRSGSRGPERIDPTPRTAPQGGVSDSPSLRGIFGNTNSGRASLGVPTNSGSQGRSKSTRSLSTANAEQGKSLSWNSSRAGERPCADVIETPVAAGSAATGRGMVGSCEGSELGCSGRLMRSLSRDELQGDNIGAGNEATETGVGEEKNPGIEAGTIRIGKELVSEEAGLPQKQVLALSASARAEGVPRKHLLGVSALDEAALRSRHEAAAAAAGAAFFSGPIPASHLKQLKEESRSAKLASPRNLTSSGSGLAAGLSEETIKRMLREKALHQRLSASKGVGSPSASASASASASTSASASASASGTGSRTGTASRRGSDVMLVRRGDKEASQADGPGVGIGEEPGRSSSFTALSQLAEGPELPWGSGDGQGLGTPSRNKRAERAGRPWHEGAVGRLEAGAELGQGGGSGGTGESPWSKEGSSSSWGSHHELDGAGGGRGSEQGSSGEPHSPARHGNSANGTSRQKTSSRLALTFSSSP